MPTLDHLDTWAQSQSGYIRGYSNVNGITIIIVHSRVEHDFLLKAKVYKRIICSPKHRKKTKDQQQDYRYVVCSQ